VRTDDDSWDITTSVGATALFVATARALEAQKPDPLANDPFAEIFCRAVGGSAADVLDGNDPDHQLKTPDWGAYFVNFQGARTRYFDDYFRRAAAAGVGQVVILAAGLDSRAYRLPWPDGTTIFELDRPQILDFKREVLAERGATPNAERREIAVDLRDDWPQALRDNGFEATKPSAAPLHLPISPDSEGRPWGAGPAPAHPPAPMPPEAFDAAVQAERAAQAEGDERSFFQLVYNERHAPAEQWFGEHGWTAVATPLADYLREVGRPVPEPDTEAGQMVAGNTLVRAVKQ